MDKSDLKDINDLKKDLQCINNKLICKQLNGKYMEFSPIGNFLTVINEPKSKFFNYWESKYNNESIYAKNKILKALQNKFDNDLITKNSQVLAYEIDNDLISIEDMVYLINNAKYEPEKNYALHLLLNTPYKKEDKRLKWMDMYKKQFQE